MTQAISEAWLLLLSTHNGLSTGRKVGFEWARSGINLIQGHVCIAVGGQTCCTHASTHEHMLDIGTNQIFSNVWTHNEFATSSFVGLSTFCKCGNSPMSCHHALLSQCTSCLAQGGKEALITHPQSLANYCLLTGSDKPVATTPRGWGQTHRCGRTTWVERGL